MLLTNFSFADDFIALEQNENYYDLHNNFKFINLSYEVASRRVSFSWQIRNEEWVSETDPYELELVFESVKLFKVKERDSDEPYSEDDCLSTIGFVHIGLVDELECYHLNVPTIDECHLNICFESGFAVKVSSGKATLVIKSSL